MFTVRTQNQAGTYPDDPASVKSMMELLRLGLRSGAEVLDVEAAWGEGEWGGLVADARGERYGRGKTLLMGSHHVPHSVVSDEEARRWAAVCEMGGAADAVKLILSCDEEGGAGQALRCCEEEVRRRVREVGVARSGVWSNESCLTR